MAHEYARMIESFINIQSTLLNAAPDYASKAARMKADTAIDLTQYYSLLQELDMTQRCRAIKADIEKIAKTVDATPASLRTELSVINALSAFKQFAQKVSVESLRSKHEIEADISLLPEVQATLDSLVPGTERKLGDNKRLYISLDLNQVARDTIFKVKPIQSSSSHFSVRSLSGFRQFFAQNRRQDSRGDVRFTCYAVGRSERLQDITLASSHEYVIEIYGGRLSDATTTSIELRLSQSVHEAFCRSLVEFDNERKDFPQSVAVMSLDVPSELCINNRKVEGDSETFRGRGSGSFNPKLFHLHFFRPPPCTEPEVPRDYFFDFPHKTYEIREYL